MQRVHRAPRASRTNFLKGPIAWSTNDLACNYRARLGLRVCSLSGINPRITMRHDRVRIQLDRYVDYDPARIADTRVCSGLGLTLAPMLWAGVGLWVCFASDGLSVAGTVWEVAIESRAELASARGICAPLTARRVCPGRTDWAG